MNSHCRVAKRIRRYSRESSLLRDYPANKSLIQNGSSAVDFPATEKL
jgi:hypothetical protein